MQILIDKEKLSLHKTTIQEWEVCWFSLDHVSSDEMKVWN